MMTTFKPTVALFLLCFSEEDAANSTYMVNNCRYHVYGYLKDRKVLQVNDSMLLELLPLSRINQGEVEARDCIATYRAPKGMKLLIYIEELKLNYDPGTIDRLHIYNGANILRELSPNQGLFGNYQHDNLGEHTRSSEGIKDYTSSQRTLTLRYTGIPTPEFPGFRVLFTSYQDTNHLGLCRGGMVLCAINSKCVFNTVKCDGHQNCGDGDTSDEEECSVTAEPQSPATGARTEIQTSGARTEIPTSGTSASDDTNGAARTGSLFQLHQMSLYASISVAVLLPMT